MICPECLVRDIEPDRETCFRCRVRSVGFTFVGGGGYGRQNFVERTNAEWVAEHVGDTKRPGVAPVGSQGWQG